MSLKKSATTRPRSFGGAKGDIALVEGRDINRIATFFRSRISLWPARGDFLIALVAMVLLPCLLPLITRIQEDFFQKSLVFFAQTAALSILVAAIPCICVWICSFTRPRWWIRAGCSMLLFVLGYAVYQWLDAPASKPETGGGDIWTTCVMVLATSFTLIFIVSNYFGLRVIPTAELQPAIDAEIAGTGELKQRSTMDLSADDSPEAEADDWELDDGEAENGKRVRSPKEKRKRIAIFALLLTLVGGTVFSNLASASSDSSLADLSGAIIGMLVLVVITVLIPLFILTGKRRRRRTRIVVAYFTTIALLAVAVPNAIFVIADYDSYRDWETLFNSFLFFTLVSSVVVVGCWYSVMMLGLILIRQQSLHVVNLNRIGAKHLENSSSATVAVDNPISSEASASEPATHQQPLRFSICGVLILGLLFVFPAWIADRYEWPVVFSTANQRLEDARIIRKLCRNQDSSEPNSSYALNLTPSGSHTIHLSLVVDEESPSSQLSDAAQLSCLESLHLRGLTLLEDGEQFRNGKVNVADLESLNSAQGLSSISFEFIDFVSPESKPKLQLNANNVRLSGCKNIDPLLKSFTSSQSVQWLSIDNSTMTNPAECVASINQLKNLKWLSISMSNWNRRPFEFVGLSVPKGSVNISVYGEEFTDEFVSGVNNVTGRVSFWGTSISSGAIDEFAAANPLADIEYGSNKLKLSERMEITSPNISTNLDHSDFLKLAMKETDDLKEALALAGCEIEFDDEQNVIGITTDRPISLEGIEHLRQLKHLRQFRHSQDMAEYYDAYYSFTAVSFEDFRPWAEQMEVLLLHDMLSTDFAALEDFPNLREIQFDPRTTFDADYLQLTALTKLEKLTLLSLEMPAALIKQLQTMPSLKEVVVRDGIELNTYELTVDEAVDLLRESLPGVEIRAGSVEAK